MSKQNETDFLNEVMGFKPSNLSVFDEAPAQGEVNPRIYKTNPVKYSKTDDGHYHARVKILYNPFNIRNSVVKSVKYSMRDENGFFQADSKLALNNRNCPIFSAWKKLHFAKLPDGTPNTQSDDWAKKMFNKEETKWVLVQVLEDDNQPELVGQFKAWKLPFSIWETMEAKMHPSEDSKKAPVALMDYIFGPALELDVTPGPDDPANPERKNREISYTLCEFETDASPIIQTTGEDLFSDEEIELITEYADIKSKLQKAKTEKAKKEGQAKLDEMIADVKALYKKALSYMKENSFDIAEECGYHDWDEALTARVHAWLSKVNEFIDPSTGIEPTATPISKEEAPKDTPKKEEEDDIFAEVADEEESDDDLPF